MMFKLPAKKWVDLRIYMKSGNVLDLDKVSVDVVFRATGNTITEIREWKQHPKAKQRLFLTGMDLSQIEAVVRML